LNIIGLQYLVGYSVLFILAFVLPIPQKPEDVDEILCKTIGILSISVCLISFFLLFSSMGWLGTRFKGIYGNPNGLGSVAVISLIYSTILFRGIGKFSSGIFLFISICSLTCFFFAQSRGAFLAITISILIYLFTERKIKLFFFISILITLTIIIQPMLDLGMFEYYQAREYSITVDNARIDIFYKHYALFIEKPFFGQGLSGNEQGGRFPAELAYTDILSFSGIFGGGAFIFVLGYLSLIGLLNFKRKNKYFKVNYMIFMSIIFMSAGDGYISNIGNPLPIFAWLFMGNLNRQMNVKGSM